MKTGQTERSETSAYKIQTLGNYPEESVQHSEQSGSLKSRIKKRCHKNLDAPITEVVKLKDELRGTRVGKNNRHNRVRFTLLEL